MMSVGCDPSTHAVSFVALDPEGAVFIRSYPLVGKAIETRVAAAFYLPERFFESVHRSTGERNFVVGLESPIVGLGRQTVLKLGQVSGSLIAGFTHAGFPPMLVQPSSWKKEVLGRGNANKEEVARWVEREWPEVHRRAVGDQDALDAACIARWTTAMDRRTRHLSDTFLEG